MTSLLASGCSVQMRAGGALFDGARLKLLFAADRCLIRGGGNLSLTYSVADGLGDIQALTLERSLNGAPYVTLTHLDLEATQVTLQVPVQDIPNDKYRLTAIDSTGERTSLETCAITVDATPPAAPLVVLDTPALTHVPSTGASTASCADTAAVYVGLTAAAPSENSPGWVACLPGVSQRYSANLLNEGTSSLYYWAKDAAGNVSLSPQILSVDYDGTPPSLSLLSLTGVGTTLPANVPVSIRWLATDAHLGATPIDIEVSSDSGSHWTALAGPIANTGTYTWTTPNVSSSTYRVRVNASDSYGNVTSRFSSSDFAINNTAPAVAFVSTDVASPSRTSVSPRIQGAASPTITTVRLFSDAACTSALTSATAVANFTGAGIQVTVPGNTTTAIYATGTDGLTTSGCTYLTTFEHDTVAPNAPSFLGFTPASPAAALTPRIFGLASSDVTQVQLFSDVGCTIAIGNGLRVDYLNAASGIGLAVAANALTAVYGKTLDAAGNASGCTTLGSYRHDNTAPTAVTSLTHAATFASVTDSPPISWSGGALDSGSGVARFEISVGSIAGGTQIRAWSTVTGGSSPTLPYTLAGLNLTSGTTYYVNLRVVDQAGNYSNVLTSSGWMAQASTAPVIAPAALTLEINSPHTFTTTGGQPPYTYSIVSSGAAGSVLPNSGTYTAPAAAGGPFTLRVTDALAQTSDASVTIVGDITLPVISAFTLNGGATNASGMMLPLSITASDPGASSTGIAAYRFSLDAGFAGAVWVTTPPPQMAIPVGVGSYTAYAQVRDGAGNLSAIRSFVFTAAAGLAPTLTLIEPDGSIFYSGGSPQVQISWKVSSSLPIALNGVSISTVHPSEPTATPWPGGEALPEGASHSCVLPAGATGCTVLALTSGLSGAPFRVAVRVVDTAGNIAQVLTSVQNFSGIRLIAGRASDLAGGSGVATNVRVTGGPVRDPISGDLFYIDQCAIYRLSLQTFAVSHFAGMPTKCYNSGASLPANPRSISFAPGNGPQPEVGTMAFDPSGNLFFTTQYAETAVLRWDRASNLIDVYVGNLNGASRASGTHRLSFDFRGSTNCDNCRIRHLMFGKGGRLYFSARSELDGTTAYSNSQFSQGIRQIYRVEDDGTATWLAGRDWDSVDQFAANGADPKSVHVFLYTVVPGVGADPDQIYFRDGGRGTSAVWGYYEYANFSGIYRFIPGGTTTLVRAKVTTAGGDDMIHTLRYDAAIDQVMIGGYNQFPASYARYGLCPRTMDAGLTNCTDAPWLTAGPDIYRTDPIVLAESNAWVYPESAQGFRLLMRTTDGTISPILGIDPSGGDGGRAVDAEIRNADRMAWDTSHNLYFNDAGNGRMRKIDPYGVISHVAYGNYPTWTGVRTVPLFNGRWSLSGSCLFMCSSTGSSDPGFIETDSGVLTGSFRATEWDDHAISTAYDGPNDTYYNASRYNNVGGTRLAMNSVLKKTDASNLISTLSEPTSTGTYILSNLNYDASPMQNTLVHGQVLASGQVGQDTQIHVVDGVVFKNGGSPNTYLIFTVDLNDATPTWTAQTGTEAMSYRQNFTVDRRTKAIYFIDGARRLYRKDYLADGSGAITLVRDFSAIFGDLSVASGDPLVPHVLLLRYGDALYTYTDPVGIP